MRVLVTGGSGFIGSHVVDKLRARGHQPVIYDLRPSPWHEPGSVDTTLGSITDREAAVIPAFVNKALCGEPLTIAGDGSQSRRFVYVEDLAMGVALALNDTAKGRVYNLASDETVTIKQIAEAVSELVGEVEIAHAPARPGDFGGKIVSSERAMTELGWTAATPFSEGVRRYVEWRTQQAAATSAREASEVIPAGEPDAEAKPRQVLIISADIG